MFWYFYVKLLLSKEETNALQFFFFLLNRVGVLYLCMAGDLEDYCIAVFQAISIARSTVLMKLL